MVVLNGSLLVHCAGSDARRFDARSSADIRAWLTSVAALASWRAATLTVVVGATSPATDEPADELPEPAPVGVDSADDSGGGASARAVLLGVVGAGVGATAEVAVAVGLEEAAAAAAPAADDDDDVRFALPPAMAGRGEQGRGG